MEAVKRIKRMSRKVRIPVSKAKPSKKVYNRRKAKVAKD